MEDEAPRFSIVAPNWNEMPHLTGMFLESLVEQSCRDFEVIIVDGGSTDGSRHAAAEYVPLLNLKWLEDETRNIGYIRNLGARHARGELILQSSADIRFEPGFLQRLHAEFDYRPKLVAIGGRTIPVGEGSGWICRLAYWGFDRLRAFYTWKWLPEKHRKFRPAGNFMCIYRELFWLLNGYPEVKINEDGLFGYRVDDYVRETGLRAQFSLKYGVEHNIKRFKAGGVSGVLFYLYVLRNFFPWFDRWLKPLEEKRAEQFSTRSDLVAEHD